MSINRWMDKEIVVHIDSGILLSYRKQCIWISSNEVDEPRAYYTEWSKSERDKYHIKHIYMVARKIILMILLLQDSKRDTNIENRLMVTMGKEEGEMTWENSIKTYTWPYVKKIGSGNLLYDTGNPKPGPCDSLLLLLLLSHFSRIQLCATPETAAHQASPSLGFSRQEHWSGLPFPSPMHES